MYLKKTLLCGKKGKRKSFMFPHNKETTPENGALKLNPKTLFQDTSITALRELFNTKKGPTQQTWDVICDWTVNTEQG